MTQIASVPHEISAALLMIGLLGVGPTYGDGLYGGVGLSYSAANTTADTIGLREARDQYVSLGATVGYEWELGEIGIAAELSADAAFDTAFEETSLDLTCDMGAQGRYFCTHDGTARLRAVAAYDLSSGYTLLGSVGYGMMWGDASTSPLIVGEASNAGFTLGIGVEREGASGFTHRIELIYDNFDDIRSTTGGSSGDDNRSFEAISISYRILSGR